MRVAAVMARCWPKRRVWRDFYGMEAVLVVKARLGAEGLCHQHFFYVLFWGLGWGGGVCLFFCFYLFVCFSVVVGIDRCFVEIG